MNKILAFDIETASPAPSEGESWNIGVTCAATITSDGTERLWCAETSYRYQDRMPPPECRALIQYLIESNAEGYAVVGINSLGFDLRVLVEECGDLISYDNLRDLALDHFDPAFQILCERGFMIGMRGMSAGFGLAGKTEGMDGLKAIEAWKGTREDQERVLDYVAQDARITLEICQAIIERGAIIWRNRYDQRKRHNCSRLLTVRECLALPLPDTSWATDPWPREKFSCWLGI